MISEWRVTHDNVEPYSWCVWKGHVPVKRFIREQDARAFHARAVEVDPPLHEAHLLTASE